MACSLAIRLPLLACLSFVFVTRQMSSGICLKEGMPVACAPGQDHCGEPFQVPLESQLGGL